MKPLKPSALVEGLARELKRAGKLGRGFSKEPIEALEKGLLRTGQIARFFAKMLRTRNFGKLDDFFFSREALPPGGKEYWFIDVVSTQGDKTQLVLTFGSSDAKASVNRHAAAGGKVAAVGWFFTDRKEVFLDDSLPLACSKGLLKTSAFTFKGAYPSYELAAGRGTRIRFSKPGHGIVHEAQPCSPGNLGIGLLNMYLDARGTIGGRKFRGTGYVQKVVVVAPFIPWNWVRVVFPDKSALEVFVAGIDWHDVGYKVLNKATYRLASGKTYELKKVKFRHLAKDRWILEGKGFAAYLKTYAFKPFVLKGRGEFHYDEYLVECEDFAFSGFSKQGGIGMVEDAYGFMI